jgi:polyferredoxin
MADVPQIPFRSWPRAALLALPMALWALLMMRPAWSGGDGVARLTAFLAEAFMVALFLLMLRTGRTQRWRKLFFITLGFLFPAGFIIELVRLRGSMSLPVERVISGDTPFCFMVIPMTVVPAALSRVLIFPGSILPKAGNPHAVATMVALWLVATLVLGKAWCAYGCFFGGLEEGFASLRRRPVLKALDPVFRYGPWAVLATIVLLSAASYAPTYCQWLCPFKAVTEFPEVTGGQTLLQAVIFVSLFLGLVVVLPLLTKKRTQCAFFCPFGAFQTLFARISPFRIRIHRDDCRDCGACARACPTLALDAGGIRRGAPRASCMRCGACVDACGTGAVRWHLAGTRAPSERARLLFLYAGWGFACLFGGTIIASSLASLIRLFR